MLHIDRPGAADHLSIRRILRDAFPSDAEARLVDRLRRDGDLVCERIARAQGETAGYVAVSNLRLRGQQHGLHLACLAPVAVAGHLRHRQLGSALITAAIATCTRAGFDALFVLGEPDYYGRFGFRHEPARRFAAPWSDHPAHQAIPLTGRFATAGGGRLCYAMAFSQV